MFRDPCAILYVSDLISSFEFYSSLLGFEETYRWPPEGEPEYIFLRLGSHGIGIATKKVAEEILDVSVELETGPSFELCLYVDDVDQAAEELLRQGVKQRIPPVDRPWGERSAYFEDPDGNPIQITAPITGE